MIVFATTACTQAPVATARSPIEPPEPAQYSRLIALHTRKTDQYAGLYQTFQADATLLTTEVQTASLKQRANFLGWDEATYRSEREKMLQEASAYSKTFLRFYSPEHDYDDLGKPRSIWKVYLDLNGNRFEGKVRRMTEKLVEVQSLFPHFDRFSTPYEVTFSVPMNTVEQAMCKVVLTSSLGTAEFVFPANK